MVSNPSICPHIDNVTGETCTKCAKRLTQSLAMLRDDRDRLSEELRREINSRHAHMLRLRGVEDPCESCGGLGVRGHSDTSTWRRQGGGQTLTHDICDRCWGSGDKRRSGPDVRRIESDLRKAAVDHLSEQGQWMEETAALRAKLDEALVEIAKLRGPSRTVDVPYEQCPGMTCRELRSLETPHDDPHYDSLKRTAAWSGLTESLAHALSDARRGEREAREAAVKLRAALASHECECVSVCDRVRALEETVKFEKRMP